MNKFVLIASHVFIWALCIVGIITISLGTHEFIHYLDARKQNVTVEIFCVFGFYDESENFFRWSSLKDSGGTMGYVKGKKYYESSEKRANNISFAVFSILSGLFIYIYLIIPYTNEISKYKNYDRTEKEETKKLKY